MGRIPAQEVGAVGCHQEAHSRAGSPLLLACRERAGRFNLPSRPVRLSIPFPAPIPHPPLSLANPSSGLSAEYVTFTAGGLRVGAAFNLLRPEALEAMWYMWRITRDWRYRTWGWHIFQAFETHCKVRRTARWARAGRLWGAHCRRGEAGLAWGAPHSGPRPGAQQRRSAVPRNGALSGACQGAARWPTRRFGDSCARCLPWSSSHS